MTRVDFYILPDASTDGRERLACRLADKAYRLGHEVYIHARDRQHAARLDELLWTFRAGSFVPHQRVDEGEENRRSGRERFRFYRDRGYALETHTLNAQTEDE